MVTAKMPLTGFHASDKHTIYSQQAKKQDFHSFRHNVSDFYKQHDIPDTQAAAVLGHADQTITYGRYGKDLKAPKLIKLVDILDFSNQTNNIVPWTEQQYSVKS